MTTQAAEPSELDFLAIAGDGVQGITEDQRREVADALAYLASVLGMDVLRDAAEFRNPRLGMMIANRAPWTRAAIIELANQLRAVAGAANLESLLGRLRSHRPDLFYEGRSVLHVAAEFGHVRSVLAFEPSVLVVRKEKKPKKPDFSLRHPTMTAEAYVEVSQLQDSFSARRGSHTVHELIFGFARQGVGDVASGGVVHRTLSPPSIEHFVGKMAEAARKALATGRLEVIEEPGTLEFGVVPKAMEDELKAWAEERGTWANAWQGPPNDMDDPERVCGKIREKIQQLPTDRPGLIAITGMSCGWLDRKSADQLMVAVAEEVYRYENLAAVVVGFGAWHGAVAEQVGHNFLLSNEATQGRTTRTIVALNPHCDVADAEAFRKLVRATFVDAVPDPAAAERLNTSPRGEGPR